MKIKRKKKKQFQPIVLTIETEQEYLHLLHQTIADGSSIKQELNHYSDEIEQELYDLLSQFRY